VELTAAEAVFRLDVSRSRNNFQVVVLNLPAGGLSFGVHPVKKILAIK